MKGDHERFMAMAIEEAKRGLREGEQPFGAVVVRDGQVISRARSLKVSTSDATAHAETLAVKYATQKLKDRLLTGCTFYATCEPCPMCCGAILNAGVPTLVMGARNARLGGITHLAFNFHEYTVERLAGLTGSNLQVISGVMEEECIEMYRNARVPLTR